MQQATISQTWYAYGMTMAFCCLVLTCLSDCTPQLIPEPLQPHLLLALALLDGQAFAGWIFGLATITPDDVFWPRGPTR